MSIIVFSNYPIIQNKDQALHAVCCKDTQHRPSPHQRHTSISFALSLLALHNCNTPRISQVTVRLFDLLASKEARSSEELLSLAVVCAFVAVEKVCINEHHAQLTFKHHGDYFGKSDTFKDYYNHFVEMQTLKLPKQTKHSSSKLYTKLKPLLNTLVQHLHALSLTHSTVPATFVECFSFEHPSLPKSFVPFAEEFSTLALCYFGQSYNAETLALIGCCLAAKLHTLTDLSFDQPIQDCSKKLLTDFSFVITQSLCDVCLERSNTEAGETHYPDLPNASQCECLSSFHSLTYRFAKLCIQFDITINIKNLY